jgi:hypothetical protein
VSSSTDLTGCGASGSSAGHGSTLGGLAVAVPGCGSFVSGVCCGGLVAPSGPAPPPNYMDVSVENE